MNRRDGEPCLSIVGARGSGKTTLAHALLVKRNVRRRLILDPMDEYDKCATTRVASEQELFAYFKSIEQSGEFSVRYVPEDQSEADAAAYMAEVAYSLENCTMLMDEAQEAANVRADPTVLVRICKRGRHRRVALWCVSQRPSDIHPSLRAELNASESWVLRLAEWRDLEIIRQRRGPQVSALVARLPPMQAIRIVPDRSGVTRWRVRHPLKGRKAPTVRTLSKYDPEKRGKRVASKPREKELDDTPE